MKLNILSVCTSFVVFTTLFTSTAKSQVTIGKTCTINDLEKEEKHERMSLLWSNALENVRLKYGVSEAELQVFIKFETNPLHLLRGDAQAKSRKADFDPEALLSIAKEAETNLSLLFEKFQNTEKQYPSSVDEYRHVHSITSANPCDSTGCTNIDFDQGTLNTWYGYYAENNSTTTNIIINSASGGALGAVTEACNDPLAIAVMAGLFGTSLTNDYQLSVTHSGYDNIVPSIPRVSPWSSSGYSVMVGDSDIDGQGVAILSKTFLVTPSTANLTYQYAVFLNNAGHDSTEQPFFSVVVLDENGDTIPLCGIYNVVTGYGGNAGFDTINFDGYDGVTPTYYKNWTLVNVPLKNYIGQCVTIEFEVADCSPGGHFAYAYVDASCSPPEVISSSPSICGEDSISLTAPPGSASYAWTGPLNGILSDTSLQTIWVDSAGVYKVITVPVTGVLCADTISITVGNAPGPPPTAAFHATQACSGQAVHFINTSTDTSTASFYWDFYNIGIYNDTNVIDPTWVYTSPGTYTVTLKEIYNGCGKDTSVVITVDSTVGGDFTVRNSCVGTLVTMSNTTTGATSYFWNYGDPSGGTSDTATITNGSYTYTAVGTYTITLIAKNNGPCPDTVIQTITINSIPKPIITGIDSVCPGYNDTLTVIGGTTFAWSTGGAGSSVVISSSTTQTITVAATNGVCTHDTSFVVYRVSPIPTITASRNPTCPSDTLTLFGSGISGSSYKWSTGSTSTSIIVNPSIQTTYTLYETLGSCTDSSRITIGIISPTLDTLTKSIDSVCPGTLVTLTAIATGGSSIYTYTWSTGGTTSSINVNDTVTTTYTAIVTGACNNVTKTITAVVVPNPKPIISGDSWRCKFDRDTLTVSSSTNPTTYKWNNGSTKSTYITGDIESDSVVYVLAYNSLGCKDSIAFPIALRTAPLVTVTHSSGVCTNQPVELVAIATGTGPYTYSWSTGQTTDSITVPSPADSTTVTYTAYVSNGCSTTKAVAITSEFPVLNVIGTQTVTLVNDTLSPAYVTLWANGNSDQYFWQDSILVTCVNPNVCDTVRVSPTVTTTYAVTGEDKAGCTVTGYVTVVVDVPCFNFIVPNVFTPNFPGPMGHDNVFYIKTENIDGWSITIFDRWGKEMYTSTDAYKYWDGTNKNGDKAADGVYYYIITGVCQNTTYKKEGFVQLIR